VHVQLCRSPHKVQKSCVCACLFLFLERSLHAPFIGSRRCRVTRCRYMAQS
jgi:hypothetical protein